MISRANRVQLDMLTLRAKLVKKNRKEAEAKAKLVEIPTLEDLEYIEEHSKTFLNQGI